MSVVRPRWAYVGSSLLTIGFVLTTRAALQECSATLAWFERYRTHEGP